MAQRLKLVSPGGSEAVYYDWPLQITSSRDEAMEITDTIRWVSEDFPELKFAVKNIMLEGYDSHCFESMTQLCHRYNKALESILQLWKGRAPPPKMFKRPTKELLRHIINVCYNHAIKEPERLNIYEPFSPEVYGETSFDMVSQIIDEVDLDRDETFIDLGSGVGQVVLQAAASTFCKECYGIEKAETPAFYAQAMGKEFKKWMAWFGKTYSPFKLVTGDFLSEESAERINEAGITFVNNFAFGPLVNHQLKSRFQTMKEGARIVSSREFCPLSFKCNARNLSELGSMIRVSEMKPRGQSSSVSWTGKVLSYYVHVVDRTRLEKFFAIIKKKREGVALDEDEQSLCSESNASVSTSSPVEFLDENLEDLFLGATTRHQWQVLTTTIEESRKEEPRKENNEKPNKLSKAKSGKGSLLNNLQKQIMKKYDKQEKQKSLRKSLPDLNLPSKSIKNRHIKNIPKSTGKAQVNKYFETELDLYLRKMKESFMQFAIHANTDDYQHKVKQMVEMEQLKQEKLNENIACVEEQIQVLIENGLTNLNARIDEVGLVVKTPDDLLTQSVDLSNKHQHLQDQVLSLETEVYILEEKHRQLLNQPGAKPDQWDIDLGGYTMCEPERTQYLTNKLCHEILTTLNHRQNLLADFATVSSEVEILEKLNQNNDDQEVPFSTPPPTKKKRPSSPKKQKPVALVPPIIHIDDEAPATQSPKRGPGRPRKDLHGNQTMDDDSTTLLPLPSVPLIQSAMNLIQPMISHGSNQRVPSNLQNDNDFLSATETLLSLNPYSFDTTTTLSRTVINPNQSFNAPLVARSFSPIVSSTYGPHTAIPSADAITSNNKVYKEPQLDLPNNIASTKATWSLGEKTYEESIINLNDLEHHNTSLAHNMYPKATTPTTFSGLAVNHTTSNVLQPSHSSLYFPKSGTVSRFRTLAPDSGKVPLSSLQHSNVNHLEFCLLSTSTTMSSNNKSKH